MSFVACPTDQRTKYVKNQMLIDIGILNQRISAVYTEWQLKKSHLLHTVSNRQADGHFELQSSFAIRDTNFCIIFNNKQIIRYEIADLWATNIFYESSVFLRFSSRIASKLLECRRQKEGRPFFHVLRRYPVIILLFVIFINVLMVILAF